MAPPKAPVFTVALYGLLIGVGQFGLLFIAIGRGFPVGLASLVIMAQVFFTILLAWMLLSERPRRAQIVGVVIGFLGMVVIGSAGLAGASFGPFLLVVLASFFWASGNVLAKIVGKVDMLAFTVWSSLAAPLPLALLTLAIDGTGVLAALAHPSWRLVASVLVLSYAGTVFGFGVWARLLAHYSAAAVAPFALLAPVVGMVAGFVVLASRCGRLSFSAAFWYWRALPSMFLGDWTMRRRAPTFR